MWTVRSLLLVAVSDLVLFEKRLKSEGNAASGKFCNVCRDASAFRNSLGKQCAKGAAASKGYPIFQNILSQLGRSLMQGGANHPNDLFHMSEPDRQQFVSRKR